MLLLNSETRPLKAYYLKACHYVTVTASFSCMLLNQRKYIIYLLQNVMYQSCFEYFVRKQEWQGDLLSLWTFLAKEKLIAKTSIYSYLKTKYHHRYLLSLDLILFFNSLESNVKILFFHHHHSNIHLLLHICGSTMITCNFQQVTDYMQHVL